MNNETEELLFAQLRITELERDLAEAHEIVATLKDEKFFSEYIVNRLNAHLAELSTIKGTP